jgi:DNA-binding transcriptional regulator YdaS (Cro superfamily)
MTGRKAGGLPFAREEDDFVGRMLALFGSHVEIAELLDVHPTAVSKWLRRHRVIPPLRVLQLKREAARRGIADRFDAEALMRIVKARSDSAVERRRNGDPS